MNTYSVTIDGRSNYDVVVETKQQDYRLNIQVTNIETSKRLPNVDLVSVDTVSYMVNAIDKCNAVKRAREHMKRVLGVGQYTGFTIGIKSRFYCHNNPDIKDI